MKRLKSLWRKWRTRKIRARLRLDLEAGRVPWDRRHRIYRRLSQIEAQIAHARSEHDRSRVRELEHERWVISAEVDELCAAEAEGIIPDGRPSTYQPRRRRRSWLFGDRDTLDNQDEPDHLVEGVRVISIPPR